MRDRKKLSMRIALVALLVGALAAMPLPAQQISDQTPAPGVAKRLAGNLSALTAKEYRERARYPEHSRAIAPGDVDPIRAKRVPTPHALSPEGSEGPTLSMWADEVAFVHPNPVDLYVSISGNGWFEGRDFTVTGEIYTAAGEFVGELTYRDDGEGADAEPGDGVFAARYTLPERWLPELAETFLVKVEAKGPKGKTFRASSGFLYSNPHVALTGRFDERVVDGDLVIRAEVEVERSGRFHLGGTLYTPGGEPIGWAQAAAELDVGTHWLELPFYGLMFHERGVAGPYHLGTLALSNVSTMPNAPAELVEGAYRTRSHSLDAFVARGFGDPQLLEAADRLELEAERARLGTEGDG